MDAVLRDGIKRDARSSKGQNDSIIAADAYLDARRPAKLRATISRQHSVYAYLSQGSEIIDIKTGNLIPISDFFRQKDQVLLKITIDLNGCFVSNLDAFDAVRHTLGHGQTDLETMAQTYWNSLVPLIGFRFGQIRRPEVMIPRDIPPDDISLAD